MRDDDVIVLGDICADLTIQLPDRTDGSLDLTEAAPRLFGGGSAANVAVALSRLGVNTSISASVGDDGYGRLLKEELHHEGIDVIGVTTAGDAFTLLVLAMIEPSGERLIVVWPPHGSAMFSINPQDLALDHIKRASWLHTTGICLRESPARESILQKMKEAYDHNIPVSLDLNLRLELNPLDEYTRDIFMEAVTYCSVVFGNAEEEIVPLIEKKDIREAAEAMSGGQRIVVARQGENGALTVTPEESFHTPSFNVDVVDTLGAGDAFNGGYIAAVRNGLSVGEAVIGGHAVAAWNIGRSGARGLPKREELDLFLSEHPTDNS